MKTFIYNNINYKIKTNFILIINNKIKEKETFTEAIQEIIAQKQQIFKIYRWCLSCNKWSEVKVNKPD